MKFYLTDEIIRLPVILSQVNFIVFFRFNFKNIFWFQNI